MPGDGTDGELVRQALDGSAAAYGQLARRWSPRVLAVCHARMGRVGGPDAAEDLAQETLLRGLRGLATLSEPDRFGPWLCGIAVRSCLDWLKASCRTEVSLNAAGADTDAGYGPEAEAERADETVRLMAEVERLPEAYREVLMLYYYDDRSYQELADQLGVSAATINARLTKARAMLREKLGVQKS